MDGSQDEPDGSCLKWSEMVESEMVESGQPRPTSRPTGTSHVNWDDLEGGRSDWMHGQPLLICY